MSKTYSIGCARCRVHLWIAQGRSDGEDRSLYVGEPKTMDRLKQFLFTHQGHELRFDENCESELSDWKEIE